MLRRWPEDADPLHRSARHSTLPRRTLCPPVKSDLPGGPVADIHRAPAARKPPPAPHRLPPPTTATKRTHRNVSNQPPQVSKNQHRLNPLGLGRASKRAIQSPYPPNGVLRLYYNAAGQESPWPARARTQIRRQNFGKAPPRAAEGFVLSPLNTPQPLGHLGALAGYAGYLRRPGGETTRAACVRDQPARCLRHRHSDPEAAARRTDCRSRKRSSRKFPGK